MDLNTFAEKVNLTSNQTIHQIQELANEGFLQRVGGGYGITQKGKAALRAFTLVPKEVSFNFYFGIDQPLDFSAWSLEEFYRCLKQVNVESVEFHLRRGDFENWLREACKEAELANEFGRVKAADLKGEDLRKELLKVIDAKFGVQDLL
jgi:hypothetical protein